MKRPLTIGYITVDDPRDRRTWSGTYYFLLKALQARCAVEVLGPLRPQPLLFVLQAFNFITTRVFGKRYNYRDSFVLSKAYARLLRKRLRESSVDLVVAPAGLCTTALLRIDQPIVYFADRCTAGAVGYHKILSGLFQFSMHESLRLEQAALANADLVLYSSDWAADAARAAVPAHAGKVHVSPMGANLERDPAPPVECKFPPKRLKLLFLGVYWEEKGGPIAYRALLALKERGIAVQLVVCGATPPVACDDVDLLVEGFLNKNIPAERQRLEEHLRTADVLLLPTRFDASPIVLCEAAAYALPVLATRTGGIPTIVREGVTGLLFDMEEGGDAYADAVERLVNAPEVWQAMRSAARERYEAVLNWNAFVERLIAYASEDGLTSKAR